MSKDKASQLLDVARGNDDGGGTATAVAEEPKKGKRGRKPKEVSIPAPEIETETDSGDVESDVVASKHAEVEIEKILATKECETIRTGMDEEAFKNLVSSIKAHGILNPLLVSEDENGFKLIGGYKRLKAAKEAKLKTVPVTIVALEENAEYVGKLLGRKRPTDEMVERVIGIVDNTARESLSEVDYLRNVRFVVEADNGTRFKKDGRIQVTPLAKLLGVGQQFMRNRVLVLNNYSEKEIEDVSKAVEAGKLTWTTVHTALRSMSGADDIGAIVWPEKYVTENEEGEGEEGGERTVEKSATDVKSRAKFDVFDNENMAIRFVGRPGKRAIDIEVSYRFPYEGGREAYQQEKGDSNYKALFEAVITKMAEWRDCGEGKNKEDKEVRVQAREALNNAISRLRTRLAEKDD